MGLPTEQEQQDILDWYEKQRGSTTARIKSWLTSLLREQTDLIKMAVDNSEQGRKNAEAAWKMAQKIDKGLTRAFSAGKSAYGMDVKEQQ